MIELRGVCAGYSGQDVFKDIDMKFLAGKVLVLLGPNGCGKSTLLKAACGLLPHSRGEILLDGAPLETYSLRRIAQRVAYLPQARPIPQITARRMVLHGRFPYLSYPRRYRAEDVRMAEQALQWVDAAEVANRSVAELSGGQRQKVYLAMALAQDAETILMDEPTTFLDVRHQLEVMHLARRLAEQGKAVVLVLHDLCLAMETADELAVMEAGRLVMAGTPQEVWQSGCLERVMHVALERTMTERGWRYVCSLL